MVKAVFALLFFSVAVPAQVKSGNIHIGAKYSFRSEHLPGDIPVRIHLPPNYAIEEKRYAVLYLLEIADDFVFASAVADFLAQSERTPALIVVSINVDKLSGSPQGMIGFLDKDLLPYVDRSFRTTPRRILYGHSGRSFAAFFLMLNRPDLFDGYICPGFGLSWPVEAGRADLTAMAEERFAKMKSLPKTFVFSLGDEAKFYSGIERFQSMLRSKAPAGLRWTYIHMPEDNHDSTKLKTLYQGLEMVFRDTGK